MKKLLTLLALTMFVMPAVLAVSVGSGIGVDIITEDFEPQVWMCGDRVVLDDNVEPGRVTLGGDTMTERKHNYAFEGEQIAWDIVVWDKNGKEKIVDVFGTLGSAQGYGNDIEVNCDQVAKPNPNEFAKCNARMLEETVDWNDDTMEAYRCTLTVETPLSMYGEYWITVEALDMDGLSGTMAENEYWFLNPEIFLSVIGDLTFTDVRPGTSSYSETLLVGNDADDGSGVMLDMFISGTDFYDSSSSGAMCPTTNQLSLSRFSYFATNGAYSSLTDVRKVAPESYVPIVYGIGFNNPTAFYGKNEILLNSAAQTNTKLYTPGNVLSPGNEIALTFRLDLPEPCNGDFDTGSIYFWGEAI